MVSNVRKEGCMLFGDIGNVEFRFFLKKKKLADLRIFGDNSNIFWEVLLEIILFLNTVDDGCFCFYFVTNIDVIGFNITLGDISMLSVILDIEPEDFYREKSFSFYKCDIKEGANFNVFPIPYLYFEKCTINDFYCLNGYSGKSLTLDDNKILKYTGNVTLGCEKMVIDNNDFDLPLFFLKTTANNLTTLSIFRDGGLSESDYIYISNFPNIKSLVTWGECEDVRWIDKLSKLVDCREIGVPIDTMMVKRISSSKKRTLKRVFRRSNDSTYKKMRRDIWHGCFGDRWLLRYSYWVIDKEIQKRKVRLSRINSLINNGCCYPYFCQRWIYPEMYALLELSEAEKRIWDNRIKYYNPGKIKEHLEQMDGKRRTLVEWAKVAPADSLIPEEFYDFWTQKNLETRDTGLPFSDDEEFIGFEYVEAEPRIIISKLDSEKGPVLKYSKPFLRKKFHD